VNSLLVSGIISMLQERSFLKVWQTCFLWPFPYYLIGSDIVIRMAIASRAGDWKVSLLGLPLMYLAYVSYKLIVERFKPRALEVE
jgi:hypothetical protein